MNRPDAVVQHWAHTALVQQTALALTVAIRSLQRDRMNSTTRGYRADCTRRIRGYMRQLVRLWVDNPDSPPEYRDARNLPTLYSHTYYARSGAQRFICKRTGRVWRDPLVAVYVRASDGDGWVKVSPRAAMELDK